MHLLLTFSVTHWLIHWSDRWRLIIKSLQQHWPHKLFTCVSPKLKFPSVWLTSLRVMMLGCCPYLSRISTSSVGSLLALLMICNGDKQRWEAGRRRVELQTVRTYVYLDCVLHARSFVDAAFADGVGADADVLFDLVGVWELGRASVQLLHADTQI